MLPSRLAERAVTNLKEDIEELRRRRILVDGRQDRYLLQIFMQEAALLLQRVRGGPVLLRGHPAPRRPRASARATSARSSRASSASRAAARRRTRRASAPVQNPTSWTKWTSSSSTTAGRSHRRRAPHHVVDGRAAGVDKADFAALTADELHRLGASTNPVRPATRCAGSAP